MSYRSDRFNRAMRSLDAMAGGRDVSKWPILSDNGNGAHAIRESTYCNKWIGCGDAVGRVAPRPPQSQADRAWRLFVAEMRLVEAGLRHLVPVLLLIVENGSRFRESIWRMSPSCKTPNAARKKYFEHRARLLAFFAA